MRDKKKVIAFLLVFLAVFSLVFVSGCVERRTSIKNEQQVGEAVTNISENIEDVSSILTDIDRKLG